MSVFSGFLKSQVRHVFSVGLVVLGVVTIIPAFTGTALAHHAEGSAEVQCDGLIHYTAVAWGGYNDNLNTAENENHLSRTNNNVRVWVAITGGSGTPPADQFGAFNTGNGFSFAGTFQWPAGATSVTVNVQALEGWGNGGGPGGVWTIKLKLPTDCGSTPDVSVGPFCKNATANSGEGTVTVTFTNAGGPFANTVVFDVGAFGGQPATTVTVAVGATETRTYFDLPDGDHTISISLNGQDFSKTFTIDCDKAAPRTSATPYCDDKSNGQILLTLTNDGGEAVTFTVDGPGGILVFSDVVSGAPVEHTYVDLADGDYTITITASDGTPGLNQTVNIDCDRPDPKAWAKAKCYDAFDGVVVLNLSNVGTDVATFTITDPRDGSTENVSVDPGDTVWHPMSGLFADGDVTIPIVANGKTLDVTVTVDCDPVFDLLAICTDVTADDVYWYAIRNTEATDLVVTWDGGTLEVDAGQTVNIASTVNPLSLNFDGVEIATAAADSEICRTTVIVEKKLVGQPTTGETYSIRVSRLDGSTFFEDLTFDINAGESVSIDLPSTLFDDDIEYFIEEIEAGTASKSVISVNGSTGDILTTSGHLNETISAVVTNGYAAIQINKVLVTTSVVAGGEITYTLQAQNTGGLELDDIRITDLLPVETEWVSAVVQDNGGTCSLIDPVRQQLVRCVMNDSLPVDGLTKIITLVVRLDADVPSGRQIVNQSMAQGNFENAILAGPGRVVHSPRPMATDLTCPPTPGEVCDLSPAVVITTGGDCGNGTTTTQGGGCGTTTTTGVTTTTVSCGNGTTTTQGGGCGTTTTTARPTTTTARPTTSVGVTLPRSGGGGEAKPMMSMAFGLGCIGSALLLSRPRLPRRWRVAAN